MVAVSSTDYTLFNGKLNDNINWGQDFLYKRESSTAGGEGLSLSLSLSLYIYIYIYIYI